MNKNDDEIDVKLHLAWCDEAMRKAYDFAEAYADHQMDADNDHLHAMNRARRALRAFLMNKPASYD